MDKEENWEVRFQIMLFSSHLIHKIFRVPFAVVLLSKLKAEEFNHLSGCIIKFLKCIEKI